MGILDYFYGPSQPADGESGEGIGKDEPESGLPPITPTENGRPPAAIASTPKPKENASTEVTTGPNSHSTSIPKSSETNVDPHASSAKSRRFSFRSLAFVYGPVKHKRALSNEEDHEKKARASAALSKHRAKRSKSVRTPSSEKRARESALILRSIIIGPLSISPAASKSTKAVSKPQLNKVKAQLLQPKSANRVIAQLRALPVADAVVNEKDKAGKVLVAQASGPIHAVCLEWTEEEADRNHFNRHLTAKGDGNGEVAGGGLVVQSLETPSVATASVATLSETFRDLQIVSLISAPDLGLGEAGDGEGLLAGAVPTAETIIKGVQQITPQLMALGYATSQAILPDHSGVHPPTDRMSVLTYWWGLELVLPPPTIEYLSRAQSISSTIINFLTGLAVVNNGVREILPFVRYIAQYIDFEFNAIRSQDRGQGVVCAATWVMPAAMIPRPWDFPAPNTQGGEVQTSARSSQTDDKPTPFVSHIAPASIPKVVITPPTSTSESVPRDVRIALRK